MKLSALILTRNEEAMIKNCLKQLGFVDETIILDQFSTDNTVEIAKAYTDKIYTTRLKSFAKNRNQLMSYAAGDWLLFVDADERFEQPLIDEIKQAITNDEFAAYLFPRKNMILGKWVKHGGWYPDYTPRLFKKDKLVKWYGDVHESPQITGKFGYFNNPLIHLSARSMTQMLNKSAKWAQIEAELNLKANASQVNELKVIKAMTREFVNRYILKFGVLDGFIGLIEAIYQALHQAMVLTYLWELQNHNEEKIKEAKIEQNSDIQEK